MTYGPARGTMIMQVAILAHEKFPDRAKTAVGILRYGDQEVAAVLDRATAGGQVRDYLPNVQDAPIVAGMEEVPDTVDALVIGIAPIGGGFDDSWRADVRTALERGCNVIAGLHYFLTEDEEFVELAGEHGCELWDVRRPPEDLTVASGVADSVGADVVLTVGTDCSTGKMTTSMELVRGAREAGVDAAVVPTGQTGIMIEDWGIAVDRVISDFAAGAVERMILEVGDEYDLLVVEGQGSIIHPAYSGVTCSILHGAMADHLVLCHVAGRTAINEYEDTRIPPLGEYAELYEMLAEPVKPARVAAGAVATHHLDEMGARAAVRECADALGRPVTDPVRFGPDEILEALL